MTRAGVASRRHALARLFGTAATLLLAEAATGWGRMARAQDSPRRIIEIEARRFRYTPNEIRVRAGEAVTFAFKSIDFVHGFSLPDYQLRADLMPGRVTEVALPALAAGRHVFLCDNFCGDEHESMHGVLIVDA